jgi:hypothetical protein
MDFIHMDCTDDFEDAKNRMAFMVNMLDEDGIFCVDDFNSAEGFMRALAAGALVEKKVLWPLACDMRKVYFALRPNRIHEIAESFDPGTWTAYENMKMHIRESKVHGVTNSFLILIDKR